ncbi:leucine-rich repeat domain-containing protein [Algoriphagus confluentis]|uniref:Leucine-rich repeat domain-containing protein n=1 Tax=Algoriphagus confluentis TaxID=1697556 RepID=A0ABQ6PPS0_9BACT|nr:hypothetical protein Aconfl_21900 [Algoriphagus confluentis]
MTRIRFFLILSALIAFPFAAHTQTLKGYTKEQQKELTSKVEDQIRFLEFLLNTLGKSETSARDKDVIIRESYLKIFRDEKVQVEDDLLADRKVVTNKDVTAYLKDIEFFFKTVEFKFKIREVKPGQKDNGEVYFLASLDRTITAQGKAGEKITNTTPRFIEVNLNEKSQELKIVSIYTTKVSRDEELTAWWKSLDLPWKNYFASRFNFSLQDSMELDMLYRLVSIDTLNISGRRDIQHLRPLAELRDLKVVDISQTQIRDLSAISNVTFLENLDISNTPTRDIQFIKYADRLQTLNISNTQVDSIGELLNLKNLKTLRAEGAPISSFAVLNEFKNLEHLYLSNSGFNNPENIKGLTSLKTLDLSQNYMVNFSSLASLTSLQNLNLAQTNIQDLNPLREFENLETLDITATSVSDITPLQELPALKKVLADQTQLSTVAADDFVRKNPEVLLIHHVKDLESWWATLPAAWKEGLKRANPAIKGENPGIEVLTQTVNIYELDISELELTTLNPIVRFINLTKVNFSANPVEDLLPLSEVKTLKQILGKNTQISDLSALQSNEALESIDLQGSPVTSIKEVVGLPNLRYLNVDQSQLDQTQIPDFLFQRAEVNVIYRSEELKTWWEELDTPWKDLFKREFSLPADPNTEQLHSLTAKSELSFQRVSIEHLIPITAFVNLRSLSVFDAPLSSIAPVSGMVLLKKLTLSQMPVNDFLPISSLVSLEQLDLSNTGIEDLSAISNIKGLKKLNLSGTNLKALKGLENLYELEELDVASTNLRSLKPVEGLMLKKLSCFNTRLSSRAVDNFKSSNPNCEVRFY